MQNLNKTELFYTLASAPPLPCLRVRFFLCLKFMKKELTQEKLKELLYYDPETGIFTWKERQWLTGKQKAFNTRFAGKEAGCFSGYGYKVIRLDDVLYFSHRLAWLYMYGTFPALQIDHIDNNRENNKLLNLRKATNGQNSQNLKFAKKSNKSSGLLGVFTNKSGCIYSRIRTNNVIKYLGCFKTKEQAHEAYINEKRKLHGHNTL